MKRIDFVAAAAVVGGLVGFWQLGARLSPASRENIGSRQYTL